MPTPRLNLFSPTLNRVISFSFFLSSLFIFFRKVQFVGSQEVSPKDFSPILNLKANQGLGRLVGMLGRHN